MGKPRLVYIFDPLCGWCYAIDPAVRYVTAQLLDLLEVEPLNIGLFMNENTKPMNAKFQEHLRQGTKRVEEVSDSRFSDKFFANIVNNEKYVYESATAGIGLEALKTLSIGTNATIYLQLTKLLQKYFFIDGQSANQFDTYLDMAKKLGIDPIDFVRAFNDEKTKVRFEKERLRAKEWLTKAGRSSVPLLALVRGDSFSIVDHEANRRPEELLAHIKSKLEE